MWMGIVREVIVGVIMFSAPASFLPLHTVISSHIHLLTSCLFFAHSNSPYLMSPLFFAVSTSSHLMSSPLFTLSTSPYFMSPLSFAVSTSSHLISSSLFTPYLTLPHVFSLYTVSASPYLTLPHLLSSYRYTVFTSPHLRSPYLTSPHVLSPLHNRYLTSDNLTPPPLTSSPLFTYIISLASPHHVSSSLLFPSLTRTC